MIAWILIFVIAGLALMYFRASAIVWLVFTAMWVAAGNLAGIASDQASAILVAVLVMPALILAINPLRRALISGPLLKLFRKILPPMSQTERDAIESGTIWWDADLFSGKPDWDKLLQLPKPNLTAEEQSFLDNEVEKLCDMANDWETTQVWQDLSPAAWQFAKDNGFLGMIIPKRYGGKEFSAYMHSCVIMKLTTRCSAAAISVMVPNSLGPAELLLHYGTEEQKNHYLPRLAKGIEIPCFALTSPYAGSDAAAIPDLGVVCKGIYEGRETLGFRVTWDKRYITLGPIATVLGLAFRAVDPDGLLGQKADLGITCVLIPTRHEGVVIGRRHWALNAVFQTGPNSGKDVFIPMEWVIGGRAEVGNGWRMLFECLAAGRGISLPSSNVGLSKIAVRGTSAYAAMRRQFKTPIGKFEGIQEAMARMGGNLYMMDAVRMLTAQAVDLGERPSVLSGIAKYQVTERARIVVNNGMDVVGGKGICMGPNNFLARAYQQVPIAITVEGANILTRCLIIFGQGAIRCHPYIFKEMRAAAETENRKAILDFDSAFFGHVGFVCANFARSLVYGISGGLFAPVPQNCAAEVRRYYRDVSRLSAFFALLSDVSIATFGGSLKRRERISARLGDVLSQMYLISATLKRYEDEARQATDLPYVHWAIQDSLHQAQEALQGVLENYPSRWVAGLLRRLAFPYGMPWRQPADALGSEVAEAMQTPGASRERLLAGSYVPEVDVDPISYGELAFQMLPKINEIEARLKQHIKSGKLEPIPQSLIEMQSWVQRAADAGFINSAEQQLMANFARYGDISVQVDDFPQDFNLLADLQKRKYALEKLVPLVPDTDPSPNPEIPSSIHLKVAR